MRLRNLFSGVLIILTMITCMENRSSFFIQDVKMPDDECVVSSDRDATYTTSGIWDIGMRGNYVVHPLVVNEMSSSKSLNPLMAQTNYVQIYGAWVTPLSPEDKSQLYSKYYISAPATVSPEGGAVSLSFTGIYTSVYDFISGIDPQRYPTRSDLCANSISTTLLLRIKVVGKTTGGKDIETPYFYFPVTICCGCLVYFPPDAYDPETGMHNCLSGGSTEEKICLPGQNNYIDCRACAGNNPQMCSPTSSGFRNPWYSSH